MGTRASSYPETLHLRDDLSKSVNQIPLIKNATHGITTYVITISKKPFQMD